MRKPGHRKVITEEEALPESIALTENIAVYNVDNLTFMRECPDFYYDWGIVDPPYGLGKRLSDGGGKLKDTPMATLYKNKDWDVLPPPEYWQELFRITKNQIVFGANYFIDHLKSTRGFVCWNKRNEMPTLSQCELVWTSIDKPAKICTQSSLDLERFHPTQKPIYLYRFMFNYCGIEKGMKIIDTHLGSGSSLVAAHEEGLTATGLEIDAEYYGPFVKRFKKEYVKLKLF